MVVVDGVVWVVVVVVQVSLMTSSTRGVAGGVVVKTRQVCVIKYLRIIHGV
jgi:hypothetical protein